jgi:DNA-binding protein H-NS
MMATSKQTNEVTKMATEPKDSEKYFKGLTLTELMAKQAESIAIAEALANAVAYRRGEEIKVLADGYVKKFQAAGYSVEEGIGALRPYLPAKSDTATRAKRSTAVKGPRKDADSTGASPTPGAAYKLSTGEQWTKAASGKGAPKAEFLAAVKAGATWASLAA